jgi:hypothetical protein
LDALARIAVLITDGDSQETSQLDNAIDDILGVEFNGIGVDDVRVVRRKDYFFYGMQPQHKMRSLLMKLHDNDTQGPVLPSDKTPVAISMDDNHPIVKTYHLPLTERCINYTQIHCQEALERYGNTSCPCNHGLSQEVYDYSIDDDGGHSFAGDMCDVFDYPSPKMKPNTVKRMGAYEAINPHVAEMYALLDDAAADEQTIAFFKEKQAELTAQARTMLSAKLPKPCGLVRHPQARD